MDVGKRARRSDPMREPRFPNDCPAVFHPTWVGKYTACPATRTLEVGRSKADLCEGPFKLLAVIFLYVIEFPRLKCFIYRPIITL